jgi:hypothetical protein
MAIKSIQQENLDKWGKDPIIAENRERFPLKQMTIEEFEKDITDDFRITFGTEKLMPELDNFLSMITENSYQYKYDLIKNNPSADKEEIAYLEKRLKTDNIANLQKRVDEWQPESKTPTQIDEWSEKESDFPDMLRYLAYMRYYKKNNAPADVIQLQQDKIDQEEKIVTGNKLNLGVAYNTYLHMYDEWMGLKEPKGSNGNYTIEVNNSRVQVPFNVFGVRFTKTIFGNLDNALNDPRSINDFNIRDILASFPSDCEGKNKVTFCLDKFGRQELLGMFAVYGMFIFVKQALECVEPLSAEEMFGQKYRSSAYELNNEHIACWLSVPSLAIQIKPKLELVDTYIDKRDANKHKMYRLYKTNKEFTTALGLDDNVSYVNCFCPSTEREFLLPCATNKSAKEAVASLMMVPKGLIPHIKEFARQGEIYPVCWDLDVESDEFKRLAATERVAMTGDDYFGKLTFES